MNLKLNNVRLSYPNLFEPKSGPEGGEPKYSASFILDKTDNAGEITELRAAILAVAKEKWGNDKAKWNPKNDGLVVQVAPGKGAAVKICLRDGSDKPDTTGYGDSVMFFSASNKMAPAVVDTNPSQRLTKNDNRPLAGQYVNVAIRLWAQDNNFGKRINAQLQAVQFAADGETFGDAPVDPEQVFGGGEPNPFNEEKPASGNTPEDDIPF